MDHITKAKKSVPAGALSLSVLGAGVQDVECDQSRDENDKEELP